MRHPHKTTEYRVRYRRMMSSHPQQRVFQIRAYATRFVDKLIRTDDGSSFAYIVIEAREVGPWAFDEERTPW